MKPKKGYANQPVVPATKIAGTNPLGTPSVGFHQLKMVPKKQGVSGGFVPGSHGFGHHPKHRQGHARLSGVAAAHRLGSKAPVTNKVK